MECGKDQVHIRMLSLSYIICVHTLQIIIMPYMHVYNKGEKTFHKMEKRGYRDP